MTRLQLVFYTVFGSLWLLTLPVCAADDDTAPLIDEAIRDVVAATESRVVQLRYFGSGAGALGAAAAPVTGIDAGDGWVLTSTYGLDSEPAGILCRFADGSQNEARLVARDTGRRLALLTTRTRPAASAPAVEGRPARVGETAVALGRAYDSDGVQLSVGVVSAVGRFGGRAIQTDALVSPTNYGGPLIGLDGSLLGVLVPLSPAGQSGVSLYDSGVGFAVPPEQLANSLPTLAAGEDRHPGRLGVTFAEGNPLTVPPLIKSVTVDGPAAAAGIVSGEQIVSLAGKPTPSLWRLRAVLAGRDAGQNIRIVIQSESGARRELVLELDRRSAAAPPADTSLPGIGQPMKKPDEP